MPHGMKPFTHKNCQHQADNHRSYIIVAVISGSSVHKKSSPPLHSLGDFLLGNYSLTTGSLYLKLAGTNTVPAIIILTLNLLLHNVICT